jgi:hypothetical protein
MSEKKVDLRDLRREELEELGEEQAEAVKGGSVFEPNDPKSSAGGILVLMGDGSVRMADITDGTSNTLLVGERYGR